jgi:cytoskeletal protein RodZ
MAGFGETLQQARAVKNVTLKEVEKATRITRQQLNALEEEAFDALPPMIYQRGIVRKYAVYLDLDPSRMLALFEEAHGAAGTKMDPRAPQPVPPIDMPSHWAPNFAIIAFSVVLAAIVFAWVYSAYVAPGGDNPTAPAIVPTMTPYSADIALPTDPPVTPTRVPPTAAPTKVAPTATVAPTKAPRVSSQSNSAIQQASGSAGDNQRAGNAPQDTAAQPTVVPATDVAPTDAPPTDVPATTGNSGSAGTGDTSGNAQRIADADANGTSVAGISITAGADIQLTIVADGTTVFDGTLAAGESTAMFDGTHFDVTTSSGTNTVFTNSCGTTFNMGYEAGSATYSLDAGSDSCRPQS